MNLTFQLSLCGVFLLITVALYLYRHWLENHGDHYIHLHNDQHDSVILSSQSSMSKRCDMVDKFKYGTLVATIFYAVTIAAMATYQAWNRSIL